jgi:hypothetical protein
MFNRMMHDFLGAKVWQDAMSGYLQKFRGGTSTGMALLCTSDSEVIPCAHQHRSFLFSSGFARCKSDPCVHY